MTVEFPSYVQEFAHTAHRYYHTHFQFVHHVLRAGGAQLVFYAPEPTAESSRAHLPVTIDSLPVLFDISDYHDGPDLQTASCFHTVFKFHYKNRIHGVHPNIFPFSPISFYNWDEYEQLRIQIRYDATGNVANRQRAHTQNFERRMFVRELLLKHYRNRVDLEVLEQKAFWESIVHTSVAVCVPGARIDILDRGQLQYMAFGSCTISPTLSIDLPYGRTVEPNVHYLSCREDFSDLIERVEWARTLPDACREIGRQAQHLFCSVLEGRALFQWIKQCLYR